MELLGWSSILSSLLSNKQPFLLLLIVCLHKSVHEHIHSFNIAEHILCAKYYTRSWRIHWWTRHAQSLPSGNFESRKSILVANHSLSSAPNWNWESPIFFNSIFLAWALTVCFFFGHCSWPAVSASSQPPPSPWPAQCRQQQTDSTFENIPFNMSHPSPAQPVQILQWLPISCQLESKFLHNMARVLSSLLLFPTHPSALVGRFFLLSTHCHSIPYMYFSSISANPTWPSKYPVFFFTMSCN